MSLEWKEVVPETQAEDDTAVGASLTTPPPLSRTFSMLPTCPNRAASLLARLSGAPRPDDSTTNAMPSSPGPSDSVKLRPASPRKVSIASGVVEPKKKLSTTVRKRKRTTRKLPDVYELVDLTADEPPLTPPPTTDTEIPLLQSVLPTMEQTPWRTLRSHLPGIYDITINYDTYYSTDNYWHRMSEELKSVFTWDHLAATRPVRPTWSALLFSDFRHPQ
jgi:hypothetical protein